MSRNPGNDDANRITAEQVRKIREELQLSQEHFAQLLQVSLRSVVRWEKKLSSPAGENLSKVLSLRVLISDEGGSRDEILKILAQRHKIPSSDLLNAIQAAAILRSTKTEVLDLARQLVGQRR